jgi:hypothetical protein
MASKSSEVATWAVVTGKAGDVQAGEQKRDNKADDPEYLHPAGDTGG